ncbi:MAG TPA: glycosyltransferase family 39 protein, partial [Verrucomicrobiae bacterium]|nr:glycosyltransferase family 39 protein [Verrucomicrobiae bacterium]
MDASRPRTGRILTAAAFALLLAALLSRTFPFPATIDSLICAISVADFRPGFLDGKPTYVFLGQAVALVNALLGGDRAALMRLLALGCALFAWGMLIMAWLLARELSGSARSGAWWALLLVSSSPIFLFMAAIVEKYTVALFLVMLAALLWLKRRYAAFGIVWGLAIGAHVTAALLAVPCVVSLLSDPDRRGDRR